MELYASFNCGCSRAHWNSPWLCNASTLVIVSISNALIPLVNFTVLVWILGLVQDTNHYAFTSIFLILCLYIFWIPLIPYLCTRDAGIVLNVTGWLPCVFPLNLKSNILFALCMQFWMTCVIHIHVMSWLLSKTMSKFEMVQSLMYVSHVLDHNWAICEPVYCAWLAY